jgi:hypothetical protein
VSAFGDVHEEPVTFLATRLVVCVVVVVALGTGYFGDPLWVSLSFGLAVGGAFAGTTFILRRLLD